MPAPKYDWPALHEQYAQEKAANRKLRLIHFAEANDLPYHLCSRRFSAIDKAIEMEALEEAKRKLVAGAPIATDVLVQTLSDDDPAIRLRAAQALLDRVGMSPQASNIQIMNVQAGQAVIAPIFNDAEMAENLKAMLGGGDGE